VLAEELVSRADPVRRQYQLSLTGRAWVKAYARNGKDWWHVHNDEDLPESPECSRVVVVLPKGTEVSAEVLV